MQIQSTVLDLKEVIGCSEDNSFSHKWKSSSNLFIFTVTASICFKLLGRTGRINVICIGLCYEDRGKTRIQILL